MGDTMNLSDFDTSTSSGFTFNLRNPSTMEQLDATVTLAGPGSEAYENAREKRDGRFKLLLQRFRTADKIPADELQNVSKDFLVGCTTGWSGFSDNGKGIPYSKDACRKLYSNPGFAWIVDQVDKELSDVGNFLPKPKAS